MIAPPESQRRMKQPQAPVPCDVKDCKTKWLVVVYIRDGNAVKHSVKLCAKCFKEFCAGKSPTLRG